LEEDCSSVAPSKFWATAVLDLKQSRDGWYGSDCFLRGARATVHLLLLTIGETDFECDAPRNPADPVVFDLCWTNETTHGNLHNLVFDGAIAVRRRE
jgi:hypothetical protein